MCRSQIAESFPLRLSNRNSHRVPVMVHSWNHSWDCLHYTSFSLFKVLFSLPSTSPPPHSTAIIFPNGSLGGPRRAPRPVVSSTLEGRGSLEWSMSGCHYPSPPAPERERRYQHKVSLVVRYFMIPCNICLILLATSTLGFAVLLFLNNCTFVNLKHFSLWTFLFCFALFSLNCSNLCLMAKTNLKI